MNKPHVPEDKNALSHALVDRVLSGAPCADRHDMAIAVGLSGMALAFAWEHALRLGPEHADTARHLMVAVVALDPLRAALAADAFGSPFSPRAPASQ